MLEQLRALAALAKVDEATLDLEKELKELPARIAEMRTDVERLEGLLQRERGELEAASQLKASHESELANSGDALARAKGKGAKARNVREVDAAEREMDAVRRSIRDREEEHERLQDAIRAKNDSLVERAEKLKEFRAMHDEEAAAAEKRIAELNREIGVIAGGRDDIISVLPKNVMKRYGKIRAKFGTGVASVVGGICQACRVRIPPQQYNDMQKANSIENCPHCLRYIYVPSVLGLDEDSETDEEETAAAASPEAPPAEEAASKPAS